ncbi:MAG: helix-turn-helix domain-containing protein [Acidimicrobiales bacterium]
MIDQTATSPDGPGDDLGVSLVAAAAQLFAERGYERAGVADIAARAGVTTGAIYSRFDGKAALLAAAVDANLTRDLAELVRLDLEPTEILTRLGEGLVSGDVGANSLLLEAFALARREPAFADLLRQHVDEAGRRLGDLVERAKLAGTVDVTVDTAAVVAFSLSLAFGSALIASVGVATPSHDGWDQLIGRLVAATAAAGGDDAT